MAWEKPEKIREISSMDAEGCGTKNQKSAKKRVGKQPPSGHKQQGFENAVWEWCADLNGTAAVCRYAARRDCGRHQSQRAGYKLFPVCHAALWPVAESDGRRRKAVSVIFQRAAVRNGAFAKTQAQSAGPAGYGGEWLR